MKAEIIRLNGKIGDARERIARISEQMVSTQSGRAQSVKRPVAKDVAQWIRPKNLIYRDELVEGNGLAANVLRFSEQLIAGGRETAR